MSDIFAWNPVASGNGDASPDGWPEGAMRLNQINNSAREMMAAISRAYRDTAGIHLATNAGNAYSLTIDQIISGYSLGLSVKFRVATTNTGAATLNVNGLGAKSVVWPDGSTLRSGDLGDIVEVYWHPGDVWVLNNLARRQVGEFAPGTKVIFRQATAPVGWTQDASLNDRVLRVVSGAATGLGGAWAITGLSGETVNHTHNFSGDTSVQSGGGSQGTSASGGPSTSLATHTHSFSGTTTGASAAHSHTGDGAWRPLYADVMVATKQ